jgi:hypothetical protein
MHITGMLCFAAHNGCQSKKKKNLVWISQVKLLLDFNRVISTIPSYAHRQHVPHRCTKWLPELKVEKSCLAFTGQIPGGILTKLCRSGQYHP